MRKEGMTNIEEELKVAQEILDNNPVLAYSPGDLRRLGSIVEEYLTDGHKPIRKSTGIITRMSCEISIAVEYLDDVSQEIMRCPKLSAHDINCPHT